MSDLPVPPGPEAERELDAAEHALGVVDASSRAAADPAFAAEVAAWEARLAPLVEEAPPRAPPERVWAGIEARLAPPAPGLVARAPMPARDRRLDFWRAATAGALALAAASLVLAVLPKPAPTYPPPAPVPAQVFVARLAQPSGPVAVVAYLEAPSGRAQGRLVLTAVESVARPDRSAEMWLIPKGGAPEALGLMDGPSTAILPVTEALRGAAAGGGALAVSLEPRGGSPTGKPTGPVIASGGFERL